MNDVDRDAKVSKNGSLRMESTLTYFEETDTGWESRVLSQTAAFVEVVPVQWLF